MKYNSDVCVIGAGPSGIAAATALRRYGIPFDGYDLRSGFGGNWRASEADSPVYETLMMNTSVARSSFSDVPLVARSGQFATHREMLEYLCDYAQKHSLGASYMFNARVDRVDSVGDGWEVTLEDGNHTTYRYVVIAGGVHSRPVLPRGFEPFHGDVIHSGSYRRPKDYQDQRVLVVGFGTSAAEIAADIAPAAHQVYVSVRNPMHLFPKTILGVPVDWLDSRLGARLPWTVRKVMLGVVQRLRVGSLEKLGVVPNHGIFEEQPTISDGFISAIRRGKAQIIPSVDSVAENEVRLADGSSIEVDSIIAATGYHPGFGFLPQVPFVDDLPLYRGMVHPDFAGLFFVGLVEPLGGLWPVVETQSHWGAAVVQGRIRLPEPVEMKARIVVEDRKLRALFGDGPRHLLLRERQGYMRALRRDVSEGAKARMERSRC